MKKIVKTEKRSDGLVSLVLIGFVALGALTIVRTQKAECPIPVEPTTNARDAETEDAILRAHRIILKDIDHKAGSKLPNAKSIKVTCKFPDAGPYEVYQDTGVGFETSHYRKGDKCEVEFQ